MSTDSVDQFVEDFTLVMDNDHAAWTDILEKADGYRDDPAGMAEDLREEWDTLVDQVAELCAKAFGHDTPVELLVRQMLGNQGIAPFDRLARHYLDQLKEQEGANA